MRTLALPVTIAIALAAADAIAQTPGTINVCVKHDDGQMRLVPAPPCKGNETLYVLNQQGPAGTPGAPGAQGPIGPAGPGWAFVAANGATFYGLANGSSGYALIPVNAAGELAAVPMELDEANAGRLTYRFTAGRAHKWYLGASCDGQSFLADAAPEQLDASFGATRRSGVLLARTGSSARILAVAKNEPAVDQFTPNVLTTTDPPNCLFIGFRQITWPIEYEIDLNAAYPGPILPLAQ